MNINPENCRCFVKMNSQKGGNSASFKVLAVVDKESGEIIEKDPDSLGMYFFPYGNLFAPSFFDYESIPECVKEQARKGSCFEASWIQSSKGGLINDRYNLDCNSRINPVCISWNRRWHQGSQVLFHLNTSLVPDVFENETLFIPYDSDSELIFNEVVIKNGSFAAAKGKEIYEYPCGFSFFKKYNLEIEKDLYIASKKAKDHLFSSDSIGSVDMMNSTQLADWFKSKLRNRDELSQDDVNAFIGVLRKNAEDCVEDDSLRFQRIDSCKKLVDSAFLSDDDLNSIIRYSSTLQKQLNEKIDRMVKEQKQEEAKFFYSRKTDFEASLNNKRIEFVAHLKSQAAEKEKALQELENKFYSELAEQEKIEKDNEKHNQLLEEKKKEIAELSSNKDMIVQEIKILAGIGNSNSRDCLEKIEESILDEEYYEKNQKEEFVDEPYDDHYEDYQRIIGGELSRELKNEIVSLLYHKATVVPSISYPYILAHFIGDCYVKNILVEHEFYHFSDFKKCGLVDFWNRAIEKPESNFILIFQNINLVPPESGLQSMFDLVNDARVTMPGIKAKGFPGNLRIVATMLPVAGSDAIGLPINHELFTGWSFVGHPGAESNNLNLRKATGRTASYSLKLGNIKIKEESSNEVGFDYYSKY